MNAALSGVLLFLAFLPFPSPHLVWVALAPWLFTLERGVAGRLDERWAARQGAVLGVVFWGLHLSWVPVLVPRLGVIWPLWAYLGQLLLLTLLGAAAGAGITALRRRAHLPLPLAAALGWAGVEWARGHLLGPLRFPWSPLALPLADAIPWLQPGAWVGESGLGAGIAVVNGLVASAWDPGARDRVRTAPRFRPPRPGTLGAAAVAVALWWGVGEVRLRATEPGPREPGPPVRVGVVQPAIPMEARRDEARAPAAALESAARLLTELRGRDVDVVVLPETHFPLVFPGPVRDPVDPGPAGREAEGAAEAVALMAAWSRELQADVLVGAHGRAGAGVTNAVFRISARGVEERYDKVALVPGVERSPGGGLVPGADPAPLAAPGIPGVLICIESAWGGLARQHRLAGAGWLLNVTNDGWLAGEAAWTRTPAFLQHPRHLALRSVETGIGAVRVGNGGLTGVVTPTGAWREALPPHREGVAVVEVPAPASPTVFVRLGDLVGPGSFLAFLAGLLGAVRARGGPVDSKRFRI